MQHLCSPAEESTYAASAFNTHPLQRGKARSGTTRPSPLNTPAVSAKHPGRLRSAVSALSAQLSPLRGPKASVYDWS